MEKSPLATCCSKARYVKHLRTSRSAISDISSSNELCGNIQEHILLDTK